MMRSVYSGFAAAATIVAAAIVTTTVHGGDTVRPAAPTPPTTETTTARPTHTVPKPPTDTTSARRSTSPTPTSPTAPSRSAPTAPPGTAPSAPPAQATPPGSKAIFLTFDDGPDPVWTPRILRVLTDNHATATFFDIGQNVVGHGDLIRQIRSQGSQVGNHTWDHPSLPTLTDTAVTSQLDRTDRVQGAARCVRPPYGATDNRVDALIRARGQRVELWNVDTRDWARPGVASIEHQLLTARAGSTVLMHTGGGDRSETVAALRHALPKLRAAGYVLQGIPGC